MTKQIYEIKFQVYWSPEKQSMGISWKEIVFRQYCKTAECQTNVYGLHIAKNVEKIHAAQ